MSAVLGPPSLCYFVTAAQMDDINDFSSLLFLIYVLIFNDVIYVGSNFFSLELQSLSFILFSFMVSSSGSCFPELNSY